VKTRIGSALCGACVCLRGLCGLEALGQEGYAAPYRFSTIAGNAGYGTADGVGSDARFNNPLNITVDAGGTFYVTDSGNHTIRAITPVASSTTNWVVTTIAGSAGSPGSADGAGSAASFLHPNGITLGGAGRLYVADTGNHTIRELMPVASSGGTNWHVTTIAGLAGNPGSADGTNSAARFKIPTGITADATGNLYVADDGNAIIRMVTPTAGSGQTAWVVSTIAGSPGSHGSADGAGRVARFHVPFGITVDKATNLYVTDYTASTIRRLTPPGSAIGQTNWIVSTIAGSVGGFGSADGTGSAAEFFNPFGITVDAAGSLYVADSGNETLRKITPDLSGGQTNWVVTTIAGSVGNAGSVDGTGAEALFNYPNGVIAAGTGMVCVADTQNNTVRQVIPTASGGSTNWVVRTIAGLAGGSGSADGTGPAAAFTNPFGVAADSAGNLYVTDAANNTIRQIVPTPGAGRTHWVVTTIAGSAQAAPGSTDGTGSSALFSNPLGVAFDRAGRLFVADNANSTIRELLPTVSPGGTSWSVVTIAGSAGNNGTNDGAGADALFNGPVGIAVDGLGNLLVTDAANSTIRLMTPSVTAGRTSWIISTIAGSAGVPGSADGTGALAQFNYPAGIAVDSAGNLFVADSSNDTIRKLTPAVVDGQTNWVVRTIAGSAGQAGSADGSGNLARFNTPWGIVADAAGNLVVADFGNGCIRQLRPPGPAGRTNWVVTTIGGWAGHFGNAEGVGSAARFDSPASLTLDAAGNLYVADWYNSTIRLGVPLPFLLLSAPVIAGNQVRIGFSLWSGSAGSFHLLSSGQPGGPWITNSSAVLTTNVPGSAFTFVAPLSPAPAQFYRIQSP
jgi:secreted PhoX family phosphatase